MFASSLTIVARMLFAVRRPTFFAVRFTCTVSPALSVEALSVHVVTISTGLDAVGPLLPPPVDSFGGSCPSVMVTYVVNSSRSSLPAVSYASTVMTTGYTPLMRLLLSARSKRT